MLTVMFCHCMLFTNLCIFMTNGPPGARYNQPQSGCFDETTFRLVFQNDATKVAPPRKKESFDCGDNLSSHLSDAIYN